MDPTDTDHPPTAEVIFDHHAGGVTVKDSDGDPSPATGAVDELIAEGDLHVVVSAVAGVTFVTHDAPLAIDIEHRGEGGDIKTAIVHPTDDTNPPK